MSRAFALPRLGIEIGRRRNRRASRCRRFGDGMAARAVRRRSPDAEETEGRVVNGPIAPGSDDVTRGIAVLLIYVSFFLPRLRRRVVWERCRCSGPVVCVGRVSTARCGGPGDFFLLAGCQGGTEIGVQRGFNLLARCRSCCML